jgi:GT2 family glycosyltransferase
MPKVSVVIPVMRLTKSKNPRYFYKKSWGIKETVHSLLDNSSGLDIEFVFVQNGEDDLLTDFINKVLSNNNGRSVLISENVGVAKAWNIGVSACLSEIIIISNDDVEFNHDSLIRLIKTLISDDKIGQVGPEGGEWYFDKSGKRKGISQIEDVDEISGYFFITKRQAYNKVGGFDEYYSPAGVEEIDYSFALRSAGYRCVVVPDTGIVHHGYHGVSAKPQTIYYLGESIDTHVLDRRNKDYFVNKWYKRK